MGAAARNTMLSAKEYQADILTARLMTHARTGLAYAACTWLADSTRHLWPELWQWNNLMLPCHHAHSAPNRPICNVHSLSEAWDGFGQCLQVRASHHNSRSSAPAMSKVYEAVCTYRCSNRRFGQSIRTASAPSKCKAQQTTYA